MAAVVGCRSVDVEATVAADPESVAEVSDVLSCYNRSESILDDWWGTFPRAATPLEAAELYLSDGTLMGVEVRDPRLAMAQTQPKGRTAKVVVFEGDEVVMHLGFEPREDGWVLLTVGHC